VTKAGLNLFVSIILVSKKVWIALGMEPARLWAIMTLFVNAMLDILVLIASFLVMVYVLEFIHLVVSLKYLE
jgi:hypothetical protein